MKKATLLFEDNTPPLAMRSTTGGVARGIVLVMLIFAGTRLLTWTGTYCGAAALFRIEHRLDPPFEKHLKLLQTQGATHAGPEYRTFVRLFDDFAPLCRFDGAHYYSIISGGYHYQVPAPNEHDRKKLEQNIAFFPLFPLVCRPLAALLTINAAMVLVAHLCGLAAGILLYLWLRSRIDEPTALLTVAFAFCYPAAVYYSYGYAESLTLLLVVTALWLTDSGRFWSAAVVCGLATATRPTALAIVGVLLLACWFNNQSRSRRRRLVVLVPLAIVAGGGIICYAAYLTYRFGSPLVYVANFKAGWVPDKDRADWLAFLTLTPIWEQFKYFRDLVMFAPPIGLVNAGNSLMWTTPLNLFLLFLSLAGLGRVPRSFRPLLLLGPLVFLHSYLASGGAKFGIEPIGRYMAISVPALAVLAAWSLREWRPVGRYLLLTFFLLLQVTWAFRFGLQEWSG